MVFQSAEIRWFFKGEVPKEISEWFAGLDGIFEKQETRTDLYFQLENSASLGIKIREGRFEIKEKQSQEVKLIEKGNIQGLCEFWTKVELRSR